MLQLRSAEDRNSGLYLHGCYWNKKNLESDGEFYGQEEQSLAPSRNGIANALENQTFQVGHPKE